MSRKPNLPKSELVERLATIFREGGYDGASMAALSQITELSKASLYHYFPGGKQDMARAVLARAGMKLQRQVINPLLSNLGQQDKMKRSLNGCLDYYGEGIPQSLMNVLIIGSGADLFGDDVYQGFHAWRAALANVLVSSGLDDERALAQAEAVIARIEGSVVVSRIVQSRAPFEETIQAIGSELSGILS